MVQQGLRGFGHDIKSLGDKDTLEEHICNLLGPKFDKNGWKFRFHTTLELQEVIMNLYMHVYEKEKVLNQGDTITLEYARGLVVENNGVSSNWPIYVFDAHKKWVYYKLEGTFNE
jgi:hypothetical protein